MTRFLVAVVDGAQARFLTLEPVASPDLESGPDLINRCELQNPAIEMLGQDLWANTKTGRNRGSDSRGHSYDDHRGNHLVEFERRFAQAIGNQMECPTARWHWQRRGDRGGDRGKRSRLSRDRRLLAAGLPALALRAAVGDD
ncbi:MAG: host attachment protein [Nodosilinea sp.]